MIAGDPWAEAVRSPSWGRRMGEEYAKAIRERDEARRTAARFAAALLKERVRLGVAERWARAWRASARAWRFGATHGPALAQEILDRARRGEL